MVPPYASDSFVPFHVPVPIVPSVVKFVEPAQVLRAVFSTLSNERSVLKFDAFLAVIVLSALILMNDIADGFVRVKRFEPTVVAPRLALAVEALETSERLLLFTK